MLLLPRGRSQVNGALFLATVTLVVIVSTTLISWPIVDLGFYSGSDPSYVEYVSPGSPAAQAGLRTGDRFLTLAQRTPEELLRSLNTLDLVVPHDRPLPVTVEREGRSVQLMIGTASPTTEFQIAKVAHAVLSLICWLTGYKLGVVRRHQNLGSALVAPFWLVMGAVLSTLIFAEQASFPIYLFLGWFVVAFLMPSAVYIHVWFPTRQISPEEALQASRCFLAALALINGTLLAVFFVGSLASLVSVLAFAIPLSIVLALGSSGWLLGRAYRRTGIAHVRRQIRLIVIACLSVMLVWLLIAVIPSVALGYRLVRGEWLDVVCAAVPLAYLIGGWRADLYRLDRLITRFFVHLVTTTTLITSLSLIVRFLNLGEILASLTIATAFVAFYRPTQHCLNHILPTGFQREHYRILDAAIHH
ncbi:MAG: hypothetical protein AVDCRST_MAG93-1472, partial [uncultured Chloroflexia bacterium]